MLNEVLIALISVLGGAILGYYFDFFKQKREENIKLYETYISFTQEIAIVLKDLLKLSLKRQKINKDNLEKIKNEISLLYFKYYIFLPQEVLLELNCLHSCLQSNGTILYVVKKDGKNMTIARCEDKEKIREYCHNATLIDNGLDVLNRIIVNYNLAQYMILNFQSRMLIRQIDNFCGGDCIFKWNKYIKKKTVYDLEKINRFNRPL